jgi:ABC-type branched-subunit amino acid transport system ATPase component
MCLVSPRHHLRRRAACASALQLRSNVETLTVRDNVEAGAEGCLAGANPISQFLAKPGQRAQVRARASEALRLCGVAELADTRVASLSTGQRRLVELARCLAGPFFMLLLDEPSSGLDREETKRFGAILRTVVAERKLGILLVEHDMSLVLDICQHVYVLDFGELIFEGSALELGASPVVRAAYLGDVQVEAAVDASKRVEEPA